MSFIWKYNLRGDQVASQREAPLDINQMKNAKSWSSSMRSMQFFLETQKKDWLVFSTLYEDEHEAILWRG